MEFYIYGLYDCKSGNFGDLCTLRCDEEFIDGMTKLFGDSSVPDYYLEDINGVCYGKVICRPGYYPEIKPFEVPKAVLYGRDFVAKRRVKEDNVDG